MRKLLLPALAIGVVLASCNKGPVDDGSKPQPSEGKTFVTASLADDVKTHLGPSESGKRKVYWSDGDQIGINGVSSKPLADVGPTASTATFEFEALLDYPYNVVYPASFYKDASTITLPSTQKWAEGTFDVNVAPTVGYSASVSSGLALKNVSALVKLQIVKGSADATISAVSFKGGNGEQVCGDFTVDYPNSTLTPASTAESSKRVMVTSINQALSTTATEVLIMVPAGTYNQFTVRVYDSNGRYMDMTKASSITLAPGQIYAMSEFAFNPTGTEVIINTPEEYTSFVTDFNNGVYSGIGENVDVLLTNDMDFNGITLTLANFVIGTAGTHNYAGTFDGGGHSFKNVTVTDKALFYTPAGATIKNVVIDATCSFTKTTSGSGHWGIIARYISGGVISNCTINCNWNYSYGNPKGSYGAIAGEARLLGEVGSLIEDCTMNGNVTNTAGRTAVLTDCFYTGGVVGLVSSGSIVRNCVMNGNYTFNAPSTKPMCATESKYFIHGGVVGQCNGGTVQNCTMNGNLVYNDYVYDVFLGGVLGNSDGAGQVKDCIMNGNMTIDNSNSASASCKRIFAGGVCGRATGTSNLNGLTTKSGKIFIVKGQANAICAGGIIGKTMNTIVLTNLTNNMDVEQNTCAGMLLYVGGIAGSFDAASSITNLLNKGKITVNHPNPSATSMANCMGGIVGNCSVALNGGTITDKVSSIHNAGTIKFVPDASSVGWKGFCVGGAVGLIGGNLTNITNEGYVYVDFGKGQEQFSNVGQGGIAGRTLQAITIKGCVNNSRVDCYGYADKGNVDNRVLYLGGVLGTTLSGSNSGGLAVTVDACYNYGTLNCTNRNSKYPPATHTEGNCVGGIVGCLHGPDASSKAICKDCVAQGPYQRYSAFEAAGKPDKKYYRSATGYFAGLVGGAYFAEITNCECKTLLYTEGSTAPTVSGVTGVANNTTVSGCKVYCDIYGGNLFGGVCYAANSATAVLDSNDFNGMIVATSTSATTRTAIGAIARNGKNSTITNNKVHGTYKLYGGTETAFDDSPQTYCANQSATELPAVCTGNSIY